MDCMLCSVWPVCTAVMGPIVNVPSLHLTSFTDTGSDELISSICRWVFCLCLRGWHCVSLSVDEVNEGKKRLEGGSPNMWVCDSLKSTLGEKEQINMVAGHTTHNHTEKVWLNEAKTETRMTQMESEFRLFVLVLFHFYVWDAIKSGCEGLNKVRVRFWWGLVREREKMSSMGIPMVTQTCVHVCACLVSLCVLVERKGVGYRDTEADRKRSPRCHHDWGWALWLPWPICSTHSGYCCLHTCQWYRKSHKKYFNVSALFAGGIFFLQNVYESLW